MQSIFSSKLYKASNHKDKIKSALDNPINAELVQQLASYLDDEYQVPEYVAPEQVEPQQSEQAPEDPTISNGPVNDRKSSAPTGHSGGVPRMPSHIDTTGLDDELAVDMPSGSDMDSDIDDEPVDGLLMPTDEATKVRGKSITATTEITISVDPIVGLLNSTEDTTGVSYGKIIGDELWLYYNDKINLNNVMENAIRLLNSAGYAHLEFNRLARSDNAMVFEITQTPIPMETIESEE